MSSFSWDAFSEVPDSMMEQYDVVHIGIVMLLIANNDPIPILKNLIKLLSISPPLFLLRMSEIDT